jgi:hypothetical protein
MEKAQIKEGGRQEENRKATETQYMKQPSNNCSRRTKRISIIPAIHGKLTDDGKVSEPDVHWIVEKWLERHPEITNRQGRIRAVRGQWTTTDGLRTEVVNVTIVDGDDIAHYDPEQDKDLYEYWKAEPRFGKQARLAMELPAVAYLGFVVMLTRYIRSLRIRQAPCSSRPRSRLRPGVGSV